VDRRQIVSDILRADSPVDAPLGRGLSDFIPLVVAI
jgi:hypothetical protein